MIGDEADIDIQIVNKTGEADYVFEFDADGVSTVTSSSYQSFGDATLTIDLSSYEGGEGEFVLFESANLVTEFAEGAIDLSLLVGTEYEGSYITQSSDLDTVVLNVVPEPATLGLLGLGAGALMIMRRKYR